MRKNFVLDTNVLLHDATALNVFEDNVVNVPIYVIEEIDQFKKDLSELGRNARQVSREIDAYRGKGALRDGVDLPNGGVLRVLFTDKRIPHELVTHAMDNLILAVALELKEREPERPCVFVTKDTNLRIRADALGLKAEDYDRERISLDDLYSGASTLEVSPGGLEEFYREGFLPVPSPNGAHYPNEYVTLHDAAQPNRTALARINANRDRIEPITRFKEGVWGIRPRNREQHFALDLLLRDDIQLVTLIGKAGTGKTLLALAAGLEKTTIEESYHRMLVSRPIFPLGQDIGYLPGDIEDKLNPWMQPIHDNIELLLSLSAPEGAGGRSYEELVDSGTIQVEPLTYIRGRSIPHQYMVVDEAQNLTPHEVKTIITRVGVGTKIVFTGDPYQIDNPYVDSVNNGLTYLANRFKSEKIAGTLTLLKGERSELAELASNLL